MAVILIILMNSTEQSNTINQTTNFIVQKAQEKTTTISEEKPKQEINIENEKTSLIQ